MCMLSRFSHVQLFVTPWTVARQAPLFLGFSRQEYWSGLPYSPPGDLPDLGIKPGPPALQADSLPPEPRGKPRFYVNKPQKTISLKKIISPTSLSPVLWLFTAARAFPSWYNNYTICCFVCKLFLPLECKPHEERTLLCLVH